MWVHGRVPSSQGQESKRSAEDCSRAAAPAKHPPKSTPLAIAIQPSGNLALKSGQPHQGIRIRAYTSWHVQVKKLSNHKHITRTQKPS